MLSTRLQSFVVSYENSQEFHGLKNEIFTQGVYYFESSNPRPIIIDAGAHIGLSTLYFKKIFPGAKVIAIEPNPHLIPILEKNIWDNQLEDVTIVTAGLAVESDQRTFYTDSTPDQWWSTGSFEPGAWNHQQTSQEMLVPTRPLTDFLTEPVDFLKMDIEGNEVEVLKAAQEKLFLIKHLLIEFHPMAKHSLDDLIILLERNNFHIHFWKDGKEVTEVKRVKGLLYVEAIAYKK